MPLNIQLFEDVYEEVYANWMSSQYVSNNKDGLTTCSLTWLEAEKEPGFFTIIQTKLANKAFGDIWAVWFRPGNLLFARDAPFQLQWLGLQENGNVLASVIGQRSDRIKKKWEGKIGKSLGRHVEIVWEENK